MNASEVLEAFDNIRRAQRAGVYAPHKPLLILLALARLQRGEPRLVEFSAVDAPLKALLTEFGPSSAPKSRHYPFWHLATDSQGRLWELRGPREILQRPAAVTPSVGELRERHVEAGFYPEIDDALRTIPGLSQAAATRILESFFPDTLHRDIAAAVGLDLTIPPVAQDSSVIGAHYEQGAKRKRDPAFRERVLRAYEYRCCVCGFDLRIGQMSAGLEAAHIQWHHVGGPDIEQNGLALCALHHKLFDLGAFTIEAAEIRVIFSQHAVARDRGIGGEIQFHGQRIFPPQDTSLSPASQFLSWNSTNVFKAPGRLLQ
jgi:putative restriction endonuclease